MTCTPGRTSAAECELTPPLTQLDPIGLDELTSIAELQTRKDRKYLVPTSVIAELLDEPTASEVRVLTIADRRQFSYESVYFDTPMLASYLDAARRRPSRFKVRTRSYVDSQSCFLEVKTRDRRGLTVKHRLPYSDEDARRLTPDGRHFVATIPQASAAATDLEPILTTSYLRSTLVVGGTDLARVTIDTDLTWTDEKGRASVLRTVGLVETKSLGKPCGFDRLLWRAGYRPTTISKYCTGLAALDPGLPANKWHRVLRDCLNQPTNANRSTDSLVADDD